MPSVRGPSTDHSSAAGPKPGRRQRGAPRRPPGVKRQRQAERHRRRWKDPNSSRASHDAIRHASPSPDDTTPPMPAPAPPWSRRKRRSRPRQWRPAHENGFSAWSFLLPNPTTRRMQAAIRPDIAWTAGAPVQRGKQTETGEHDRPSAIPKSHRNLLHDGGLTHPGAALSGISGSNGTGGSNTSLPGLARRRSRSASEPGRPATLS
jgi:hypothetical protein